MKIFFLLFLNLNISAQELSKTFSYKKDDVNVYFSKNGHFVIEKKDTIKVYNSDDFQLLFELNYANNVLGSFEYLSNDGSLLLESRTYISDYYKKGGDFHYKKNHDLALSHFNNKNKHFVFKKSYNIFPVYLKRRIVDWSSVSFSNKLKRKLPFSMNQMSQDVYSFYEGKKHHSISFHKSSKNDFKYYLRSKSLIDEELKSVYLKLPNISYSPLRNEKLFEDSDEGNEQQFHIVFHDKEKMIINHRLEKWNRKEGFSYQENKLFTLNYDGELIKEIDFTVNLDKKYSFLNVDSKKNFDVDYFKKVKEYKRGRKIDLPTYNARGHFYFFKNEEAFLFYNLIQEKKKNHGVYLLAIKYDSLGNQIWSNKYLVDKKILWKKRDCVLNIEILESNNSICFYVNEFYTFLEKLFQVSSHSGKAFNTLSFSEAKLEEYYNKPKKAVFWMIPYDSLIHKKFLFTPWAKVNFHLNQGIEDYIKFLKPEYFDELLFDCFNFKDFTYLIVKDIKNQKFTIHKFSN